jgi:antirestriction protein ArdC
MSTHENTSQSRDVYQKVTDAIETGTGLYRMPWVVRQDKGFSPISVSTVKPYRGINTLVLWRKRTPMMR